MQPADAPAPPPLGAAKPAPPAPQAAKESGQESPTNPAPKASSGNVEDSGDVSDDFDGVHELSAAEVAARQPREAHVLTAVRLHWCAVTKLCRLRCVFRIRLVEITCEREGLC